MPPAGETPADPPAAVDLLVLSPSRSERRDEAWVDEACRRAADVGPDGLTVVVRPSRSLLRRLGKIGFEFETSLLHVPDIERSRFVFPISGPQSRFAFDSLIPLHPAKRLAARFLPLPGGSRLAPTSVVLRHSDARPLLDWLAGLAVPVPTCTAILMRSPRQGGSAIALRFAAGSGPDLIAKFGVEIGSEAQALPTVAAGAQRAGLSVPRLLEQDRVGDRPMLAETAVPGRPAAIVIDRSPRKTRQMLVTLAERIGAWNVMTANRRAVTESDVERDLLAPARSLRAELPDGYVEALEARAEALVGSSIPFVAAHQDVTAVNVMLGSGSRIGLVDWEAATSEVMPLGDLAYAAVDLAAASDGYRDRVSAYRHCFEAEGRLTPLISELIASSSAALEIGEATVGPALEACWLRHAANERRRARDSDGGRPFLAILQRFVAGAGR